LIASSKCPFLPYDCKEPQLGQALVYVFVTT
jgi:hypothetical protein